MQQHPLDNGTSGWSALTAGQAYREDITYDGNGNVLSYQRNGSKANSTSTVKDMDDLSYVYSRDASGNLLNNRLQQVDDKVTTSPYIGDLKNGQLANNYVYDNVGNLISIKQNYGKGA